MGMLLFGFISAVGPGNGFPVPRNHFPGIIFPVPGNHFLVHGNHFPVPRYQEEEFPGWGSLGIFRGQGTCPGAAWGFLLSARAPAKESCKRGALGVLMGTLRAPEDVFLGFCCQCSHAIGVSEVIGNILTYCILAEMLPSGQHIS